MIAKVCIVMIFNKRIWLLDSIVAYLNSGNQSIAPGKGSSSRIASFGLGKSYSFGGRAWGGGVWGGM